MPAVTKHSSQRGDTLIEVLLAITVFGVAVVGAFSLMNRGVTQMYDSMEKSEVRLLLNRQTESLTYARDQYLHRLSGIALTNQHDIAAADLWVALSAIDPVDDVPALDNCSNTHNAFSIDRTVDASGDVYISLNSSVTGLASDFPSPGDGIWMQKIESDATALVPYKDFYVRACWIQASSSQQQVLSTVVRLYDR